MSRNESPLIKNPMVSTKSDSIETNRDNFQGDNKKFQKNQNYAFCTESNLSCNPKEKPSRKTKKKIDKKEKKKNISKSKGSYSTERTTIDHFKSNSSSKENEKEKEIQELSNKFESTNEEVLCDIIQNIDTDTLKKTISNVANLSEKNHKQFDLFSKIFKVLHEYENYQYLECLSKGRFVFLLIWIMKNLNDLFGYSEGTLERLLEEGEQTGLGKLICFFNPGYHTRFYTNQEILEIEKSGFEDLIKLITTSKMYVCKCWHRSENNRFFYLFKKTSDLNTSNGFLHPKCSLLYEKIKNNDDLKILVYHEHFYIITDYLTKENEKK
ncbi:hypothetical protein M0813_26843 [Anaeramoeba flamelloides]|uniref:Uncharacterized protein n=1 Tax=Anaeramoeba flamelloides TaxID=1746091 RepID=A0ABQ8XZC1_9EUKA|nr:hypothetical protein M0813_26843 [Anaeramoeba flamelloides]